MMIMFRHCQASTRPPNLDSAINSVIGQSEEGVAFDDLPIGAVLEVETAHHTYQLEIREEGTALISGHPKYCASPVLVNLLGSAWNSVLFKLRFIGIGMAMAFSH